MKSSPPRLNPKTDLIVLRYLRFPAFFFGRFLPQTCPFAQTFRFISAAPACPFVQTFRLISAAPACPFVQTFRLISTAPDLPVRADFPPYFRCPGLPACTDFPPYSLPPAVSSRQIFLIFVLTKNFRNAIYSPT